MQFASKSKNKCLTKIDAHTTLVLSMDEIFSEPESISFQQLPHQPFIWWSNIIPLVYFLGYALLPKGQVELSSL